MPELTHKLTIEMTDAAAKRLIDNGIDILRMAGVMNRESLTERERVNVILGYALWHKDESIIMDIDEEGQLRRFEDRKWTDNVFRISMTGSLKGFGPMPLSI